MDSSEQPGRLMSAMTEGHIEQSETLAELAPAGAQETSGATLDSLSTRLEEMLNHLVQLRGDFESKLQYDLTKSEQIDFLDSELKKAREGLFLQVLRPIFLSLIRLYDMIGGARDAALRDAGGAENVTTRNHMSFQTEIEEILMRSGVSRFQSKLGSPFQRSLQQVTSTLDSMDQTQADTIAMSQRPGFSYEGKVLRPEWVVVYRYAAGG